MNKEIKKIKMSGLFGIMNNSDKVADNLIEEHKQFQEKLLRNNAHYGKVNTNPTPVKKFSFNDVKDD